MSTTTRAIVLAIAATMVPVAAEAAYLATPAAVPFASGPAFPLGRRNGNPPDPQCAADRAIDGDPETFCCLLDDTLGGYGAATIPASASAPVTGHMVFDLGKAVIDVFGNRVLIYDDPKISCWQPMPLRPRPLLRHLLRPPQPHLQGPPRLPPRPDHRLRPRHSARAAAGQGRREMKGAC